jgi:hypothetical protein
MQLAEGGGAGGAQGVARTRTRLAGEYTKISILFLHNGNSAQKTKNKKFKPQRNKNPFGIYFVAVIGQTEYSKAFANTLCAGPKHAVSNGVVYF